MKDLSRKLLVVVFGTNLLVLDSEDEFTSGNVLDILNASIKW